jgi:hypothetical protein
MLDEEVLHLEVAGRLATLYVMESLPSSAELKTLCDALPSTVDVLSLDLGNQVMVAERELGVIEELRSYWGHTRRGVLRVAFNLGRPTRAQAYEVSFGM